VSVTESSDAVNAGMAKHTDGRRLALLRKSPPSISSLVGWLVYPSLTEKSFAPSIIRIPGRPTHNLGTKPTKENSYDSMLIFFNF